MQTSERAPVPHVDPSIIADCQKRSFLKLPVAVNREKLLAEYNAIPETAWGASHWDVHCSIDMILLRGGKKGSADDFVTDDVANSPLLDQMPYIASILAPEGPFGGAHYAFIFRTKPNGITRQHMDDREEWTRTVRIHVPIITNPGAVLLAEGRSKHLEVGEVWTFDNQQIHSVMNGDSTRVHMIFDVDPNPKFNNDTVLARTANNMARTLGGPPPRDYILRIRWKEPGPWRPAGKWAAPDARPSGIRRGST